MKEREQLRDENIELKLKSIDTKVESLKKQGEQNMHEMRDMTLDGMSSIATELHHKIDTLLDKYEDANIFIKTLDARVKELQDYKIELGYKANEFKQKLTEFEKETSFIRRVARVPKLAMYTMILTGYLLSSPELREKTFTLIKDLFK